MTTENDDLVLTVEEAARRIKVSRSTTYRLIAAGEIPSIQVGTQRRVSSAALAEWLVQKVNQAK